MFKFKFFSRQSAWLLFCNNPELNQLSTCNLRRRKYICSLHFQKKDYTNKDECKRLLRSATPTVTLVSQKTCGEVIRSDCRQPQPSVLTPLTFSSPAITTHLPPSSSPSSSSHIFSPANKNAFLPFDHFIEDVGVSNFVGVEKGSELEEVGLDVSDGLTNQDIHSNIAGCSLDKFSTPKTRSLTLARIQITRKKQLSTPRKQYLYAYAKRKERVMKSLKRRIASREKQLSSLLELQNFDPNAFVRKISLSHEMSRASAVFVGSQLRCSKKKPKGRRWTLEEKVMALSLYKKSPKAYRFMRCMFALPCKKTLNCLLSGIPFGTGINGEIFATLASAISELEDCDKMCILLFDEMSIREHLSYNSSLDLIVGVEDFGTHGRTTRYANQVMVFMVSGLLKKWKQPVAYYFSSGGIHSEMLVDLIKAVLLECKKAGLRVMATVCDMGANQRKAIRLLGSTKMNPQFQFEGQNIITLYDPCHLIKCIRNQLILHDIIINYQIASETNEGKASWKYCNDTYQRDKLADTFRY